MVCDFNMLIAFTLVQEVEDRIGELEVLQKVLRDGVGTLSYPISFILTEEHQIDTCLGKNDPLHVLMMSVKWWFQKRTTH